MIKYKRKDAANGRTMYFRNGKMVSASTIPATVINHLEDGVELTLPTPEPVESPAPAQTIDEIPDNTAQLPQSRNCIFCNKPATRTTYVNLQTAHLCQEDKTLHTLGEIAAQLRKISEE